MVGEEMTVVYVHARWAMFWQMLLMMWIWVINWKPAVEEALVIL